MTKDEFVAQLDRGALQAAALPVTAALLKTTADQLRKGEPPWWKFAAKAWEKRPFVAWSEAWTLYLTALHFEALSDADCPLVPYFPSCGGTAEADPSPALARFLTAPPPSFFESLKTGVRRTYIGARSTMWTLPAIGFFQKRDLQYYLVEVNSGAGLNLAADLLRPAPGFDSGLVAGRVGLDKRPLNVDDINDRRWLTAGVFPDDLAGIKELDDAIEGVQKAYKHEPTFIQLAECAAEKAPAFIAKNVPHDDPETGLMIVNMGTTVRMTDEEYNTYAGGILSTLKPWGDRGLWVEIETVRGEQYSTTMQLRAFRLEGGAPKSAILASVDMVSGQNRYNQGAEAFLAPPTSSNK